MNAIRTGVVLRVREDGCDVWVDSALETAGFVDRFPTPRTERVSPGHLVALRRQPDGSELIVWRWYDAVVLETNSDGSVLMYEPAHGEVVATPRDATLLYPVGSRAYLSAGFPGAEWWLEGTVASGVVDLSDLT
jgi:hypothetical protein